MLKRLVSFTVFAMPCLLAAQENKPLPNVQELRARAIATQAKTFEMREHYLCRARVTQQEMDKDRVKKTTVDVREIFYVKGHEISQVVMKDGKPLSPGEAKKEIDNVRKKIDDA